MERQQEQCAAFDVHNTLSDMGSPSVEGAKLGHEERNSVELDNVELEHG